MLARLGELSLRIPWPLRFAGFLAYAVLMTVLLLAPAKLVTAYYPSIPGLDKVFHFCLFGFLVLLARWAFPNPGTVALNSALVPICALAYGAMIELAQGQLVSYGRAFEWADIVANSAGALTFWCLSAVLFSKKRAKPVLITCRGDHEQNMSTRFD